MVLNHDDTERKYNVTVFIQSLAHLNSVANPIIYMLFNTTIVGTAWFVLYHWLLFVFFRGFCPYAGLLEVLDKLSESTRLIFAKYNTDDYNLKSKKQITFDRSRQKSLKSKLPY